MRPMSAIAVLALLAGLTTLLLPNLPVLAGGLLAAGGALAAGLGWWSGIVRRPRPIPLPVEADAPRRPPAR